MNKLSPKTVKILGICIFVIIMSILIYAIIDLVKDIKKDKEISVISMQENETEYKQENIHKNSDEEVIVVDLTNIENTTKSDEDEAEQDKTPLNSSGNKSNSNSDNKNKYYIKVNCGANVVTIYTKDADGNYTVPYKAMVCSTGTATTRYLGGKYAIKSRWEWGALFGGVYGHYCVHIVDQILFHSVPYLRASPDSLEYWEYDKLRNFSFSRMYKVNG